jgi:crotonobetainyl-CoA:carnitine CoA-transferase CaiB-like acyl-CoA transferase
MRLRSAALGLAAAAAATALLRRRRQARGEHVDVWLEDGSVVSLQAGPTTEPLLAAAREALAAARG